MQGGRFCNPRRVPPATHALYSNLPEAGVQETWRISKQCFILDSKQSAHKAPTLKYFLFVHNTAIFCCFETSHWWCTSFYGLAPEAWCIEMKYFLSSQNNPHNEMCASFCAMFGTLHHDAPELWHALVQLLRCTSFLPLSTVLHQSEVFSTPSRQITTDVSSW